MRFLPALFLLIGLHSVTAADPSQELAQKLGAILEYPASEIVVQDITAQERPQAASPQSLIAAYSITGKNPATLFPIQIWVGQPGSLLTPEVQQWLAGLDKHAAENGGANQPFGSAVYGGLSAGGIYVEHVENAPPVVISVLRLPSQNVDVKIAIASKKDDITPVAGGEKYHDNFAAAKMSAGKPPYDSPKLFRRLSEAVATTVLTTLPRP